MSLRNITIPKREVPVGDEKFTVTGVSADQVFGLYHRHRAELGTLFDNLAGRGTVEAGAVLNSVEGIVTQFPVVVAETIAMASGVKADSPNWDEEIEIARSLPLPVQVDALIKIGELTFSADMPPKKFFALLVGMIQQMNLSRNPTSELGSDS
jgi:hypothetical protein